MTKKYLPFDTDIKSKYQNLQMLFGFEGGAYFFSVCKDKYFIICDSRTMSDFLDEDDDDLLPELLTVYEFAYKKECLNYIHNLMRVAKKEQSKIIIPEELH
ncbi:MAG: hypothetical protein WC557_05715 [Ignavibacteriaceae bacterium]